MNKKELKELRKLKRHVLTELNKYGIYKDNNIITDACRYGLLFFWYPKCRWAECISLTVDFIKTGVADARWRFNSPSEYQWQWLKWYAKSPYLKTFKSFKIITVQC